MDELETILNKTLDEMPGVIAKWQRGEITNKELMTALQECEALLDEYNWLQEK